jgi:hypothetical protein
MGTGRTVWKQRCVRRQCNVKFAYVNIVPKWNDIDIWAEQIFLANFFPASPPFGSSLVG